MHSAHPPAGQVAQRVRPLAQVAFAFGCTEPAGLGAAQQQPVAEDEQPALTSPKRNKAAAESALMQRTQTSCPAEVNT